MCVEGGGREKWVWVVARTVLLINNANCCCLQKFRTRFELAQPTVRCAARVLCRNFFQAFLLSLRCCCCCCCLAASLPALLLAALSVSSHFFSLLRFVAAYVVVVVVAVAVLEYVSGSRVCVCVCVSCGLLMFFSFFSFYVQRAASSGGGYALQFFPIATDFFFSLSPSLYVSARSCVYVCEFECGCACMCVLELVLLLLLPSQSPLLPLLPLLLLGLLAPGSVC